MEVTITIKATVANWLSKDLIDVDVREALNGAMKIQSVNVEESGNE